MYKGFNLNIQLEQLYYVFEDKYINHFHKIGNQIYTNNKRIVNNVLESFLLSNGNLNGSKIQENWFPQIKSNIFISHSHKDKEMAIILAGLFKYFFGLTSFVDSCIWGNSNDLVKQLESFYIINSENYNSQTDCFFANHVNIMLSTAISMMIDKTECLFFINTPNSIYTSDVINSTLSPWIYSEITMSKLIRKRKLNYYRKKFSKGGLNRPLNESIEYKLDMNHLTNLDINNIINWININSRVIQYQDTYHPLDILYEKVI